MRSTSVDASMGERTRDDRSRMNATPGRTNATHSTNGDGRRMTTTTGLTTTTTGVTTTTTGVTNDRVVRFVRARRADDGGAIVDDARKMTSDGGGFRGGLRGARTREDGNVITLAPRDDGEEEDAERMNEGNERARASTSTSMKARDDERKGDGASTRARDRGGDLYETSDVRMRWNGARRAGAGLANLGNTCFLNAVLQCLTHTPALAHFALQGEHEKFKTTRGGSGGVDDETAAGGFNALYELGEHIVRALNSSGRTIAPIAFVKNLRALSKTFRKGRQEDAHEFVRCLLDAMHKRCVDVVKPKLKPNSPRSETTFVWKVFGGKLRSQVNCKTCGRNSETFDSFLDVSLDVVRCKSVLGAFKAFTVPEVLDDDNKYKCEGNSGNAKPHLSKASKQFTVNEPPNVLALQLKRFAYVPFGRGKLSHFVEYPLELDITPYISDERPNSSGDAVYDLFAVLVHAGNSSNSGHYYCFVKAATGTWVEMDDDVVSPVSEKIVLKQQAYLLFYTRRNAPGTFEEVESKLCRNIPVAAPERRVAKANKQLEAAKERVIGKENIDRNVAPTREAQGVKSPSEKLALVLPMLRVKSPSPKRARTPNGIRPKIRSAFDAARRALLFRRLKHLGNGIGVKLEDLDLSMDSPVRTRSAKSTDDERRDARAWLTKSNDVRSPGWEDDDERPTNGFHPSSEKKLVRRTTVDDDAANNAAKRERREYDEFDEDYDRGKIAKHRRKSDKVSVKAPPLPKLRGYRNPFQRRSK